MRGPRRLIAAVMRWDAVSIVAARRCVLRRVRPPVLPSHQGARPRSVRVARERAGQQSAARASVISRLRSRSGDVGAVEKADAGKKVGICQEESAANLVSCGTVELHVHRAENVSIAHELYLTRHARPCQRFPTNKIDREFLNGGAVAAVSDETRVGRFEREPLNLGETNGNRHICRDAKSAFQLY